MFLSGPYHVSPCTTGDKECLRPSLMQLDDGKVDSKLRVPLSALGVQSHTPFADLSSSSSVLSDPTVHGALSTDGDGHAAAVSSQCFFWCFEEWLRQRLREAVVSCFFSSSDVVWATSWIGWIARSGWSANAVLVSWEWYTGLSRMESQSHGDRWNLSELLVSGPSSRHRAPVASEFVPEICNPTDDGQGGILSGNCDDLGESRRAGT